MSPPPTVLAFLCLCAVLLYARTATAAAIEFNWTDPASAAFLHRYCYDNARETACDSITLAPLVGQNLSTLVIQPSSRIDDVGLALLANRSSGDLLAIVMTGSPPDGTSTETFIKQLSRDHAPDLILAQEHILTAGFMTFDTDASPAGGEINGNVPVIAFTPNPEWAITTNSTMVLTAPGLLVADSNLWEDAFFGTAMAVCHTLFASITAVAVVHNIWRIVVSYRRKLGMKIFPLSLKSTRPIALWSNLIGAIGRLLFMLIDPMSYRFIIPTEWSSVIGVFGVPWSLITSVVVLSAWLFSIRRSFNAKSKRIRTYQIIGLSLAVFVILLSVVSMIVSLTYLHTLQIIGMAYFLTYCLVQVAMDIFLVVILYQIRRASNAAAIVGAKRHRHVKKRIYGKGIAYAVTGLLVLLTFAMVVMPSISGVPIPFLISATAVAFALAGRGIVGLELFDYTKGQNVVSTTTGSGKNESRADVTSQALSVDSNAEQTDSTLEPRE